MKASLFHTRNLPLPRKPEKVAARPFHYSAGGQLLCDAVPLEKLAARYDEAALTLSARRKAAALELAMRVEEELKPLAMDRTVFRIQIESANWSENGPPASIAPVTEISIHTFRRHSG